MASMHRARGVLKIKRQKTVSVTGRANAMCTGIGGNTGLFATPNPSVSTVQNQIVVLGKAEVLAATRAKGAAAARNVERTTLVGMLEAWLAYVQAIADLTQNQEQAVSTLLAAGLLVALVGQHTKAILAVMLGTQSGTVALTANAAALTGDSKGRFLFNWQYTADGKTFVNMPPTPKAKTTLAGLTPLSTYGFRVSITDSAGVPGEWSQVLPTHLVEHLPALELRAVA